MAPIFEHASIDCLQFVQHSGLIVGQSGPQGVVVRSGDDIQCVNLDIAQVLECLHDPFFALGKGLKPTEELGVDRDSASFP
jgi:hypothetical protein